MALMQHLELSLLDLVRLAWLSRLSLELRVAGRHGRGKLVLREGEVIYASVDRTGGSQGRRAFADMAFWEDLDEITARQIGPRHASNIEIPTRMLLELCKESAQIHAVIQKLNTRRHAALQGSGRGAAGVPRRRAIRSNASILPVVPPTGPMEGGGAVATEGGERPGDPRGRDPTRPREPMDPPGEQWLGRVSSEETARFDPAAVLAAAMRDQIPGARLAAILDLEQGSVLGIDSDLAGLDAVSLGKGSLRVWDMLNSALAALPESIAGGLQALVMGTESLNLHAIVEPVGRTAVLVACDASAGNLGLVRMLSRKVLRKAVALRA